MQYSFIVPAKWKDECSARHCRGVRGGVVEGVEAWKCAAHFALSRTKAAIEAPTIGGTDSQDTLNYSCSWRRRCKVLLPTLLLCLPPYVAGSFFNISDSWADKMPIEMGWNWKMNRKVWTRFASTWSGQRGREEYGWICWLFESSIGGLEHAWIAGIDKFDNVLRECSRKRSKRNLRDKNLWDLRKERTCWWARK